jgi:hypothetical protein
MALSGLLVISTMSFARGQSLQERLRGVWIRVNGPRQSLTFVPTGANIGQVGFGANGAVDYHFYALRGNDRIKINDLKVIGKIQFQGGRLLLKLPGNQPRIYEKQ